MRWQGRLTSASFSQHPFSIPVEFSRVFPYLPPQLVLLEESLVRQLQVVALGNRDVRRVLLHIAGPANVIIRLHSAIRLIRGMRTRGER